MSRTLFAPLVALLLASSGCDDWLTKPSLYSTVRVIVTQRRGVPIPDANLVLYTGQRPMGYAKTGADGTHTFPHVPQGIYGVFVDPPPGYDPIERWTGSPRSSQYIHEIHVAGDTVSPLRFTFLKAGPGTIVVRTLSSDGSPISGVDVIAYDPRQQNGRATTDSMGTAIFPDLEYGVHGVVVIRPNLYRDYVRPNDSLYTYRDNLVVEDGSRDTVIVRMQRCAGAVRARVIDESGAPVPGTTVAFYSATQSFGIAVTDNGGQVTFTDAPCATQLGVLITPAAGYTVAEGRGARFIDGFTVTNGGTTELTFRVRRVF